MASLKALDRRVVDYCGLAFFAINIIPGSLASCVCPTFRTQHRRNRGRGRLQKRVPVPLRLAN